MLVIPIIVATLLSGSSSHGPAATRTLSPTDPTTCPAENPKTRDLVVRFLSHPSFATARSDMGTSGLTAADVRLLSDAQDAAACARLNETFGASGREGEWIWSYFKAGNRYFVSIRHADTTQFRLGFVPLFVYDESFTRIGGYAM